MKKIAILLLIILYGCGARKVAIVKNDTKITIDSTAIVKTDSVATIQNNIVIDTQTQEIEVIPIDSTKEIVVNNVVYKNARLKIKNIKYKQIDTSSKKVAKTSEKHVKKAIVKKASIKTKNIERKQFNYWLLLWLIPIYLLWKYKWDIVFWLKEKLEI